MHQIRKAVFETNSSSSHSLTLSSIDLVKIPFPPEILRSGMLELSLGYYGWEWFRMYTAKNKIEYLFTQLFDHDNIPEGDVQTVTRALREESARFDSLCRVVKEHTGVELVVRPGSSGGVDHQSGGVGLEVFESDERLRTFLFSEENYIQTGNDNSPSEVHIQTDKGPVHFYQDFCKEPPSDFVNVVLNLTEEFHRLLKYSTQRGALLTTGRNKKVWQALREQGIITHVDWTCVARWDPCEYTDARSETAASLFDQDDMRFSKDLKVTSKFTKSKSIDSRTADVVVKVPKELAETLSCLRKSYVRDQKS